MERSPNYTDDSIIALTGEEKLDNIKGNLSVIGFWQWAYSDLIRNTKRGIFAEFLIKTALDENCCYQETPIRLEFEPFDLLGPIKKSNSQRSKLEVKSASFVQSWETHKDSKPQIRFGIAPTKLPDETGDYPRYAQKQRNCDIYIFSVYKSNERGLNILNSEFWEFYVCPVNILNTHFPNSKTISLKKLKLLNDVIRCKYNDLYQAIENICNNL